MPSPIAARAARIGGSVAALSALMLGAAVCAAAERAEAERPGAEARTPDPPTVVLLGADPNVPMSARLQAELQSLGFDVRVGRDDVEPDPSNPEGVLDPAIAPLGTAAAVRIERGGRGVEIWVADRRTGALVRWGVVTGNDSAIIALRAVEVLRTSVIDVQSIAPPEPRAPLAVADEPAPNVRLPAPPARYRFAFGVAGASGSSALGVSWDALASFRWTASSGFGLEAMVLAPLGSADAAQDSGVTEVSFAMAGLGARWEPSLPAGNVWSVDLSSGLSAIALRARGVASEGFVGRTREAFLAAPFVRAGASFAASPAWRIRLDGWAAAVVPRPVVAVDGLASFSWGRPLLLGSASVELVLR